LNERLILAVNMVIMNVSLNEDNLWDVPMIIRGTTSVVQQQQSTSRTSTAGRWSKPMLLS